MATGDPWSDPFAATMGRTSEVVPISRWLPNVHQQYKEMVAPLSLVFAVLAALLCFYYLEASDVQHDTRWADQAWSLSQCTVRSAGVAYRGSCELDTDLQMTSYSDFAECLGPADEGDLQAARRDWLRTATGQCAEMGNHDYRMVGVDTKEEESDGDSGSGGDLAADMMAASERRLLPIRPNRRHCVNSYLPWAAVVVANGSAPSARPRERCAYQFGAVSPSVTSDWGTAGATLRRLQEWQDSGAGRPCWQLASDGCVVAFDALGGLAARESAGASFAGIAAIACGMVSLVSGCLAAYWHWADHGCCGILPPAGYDCTLPTTEPGEEADPRVPLSERVGNIVRSAAARLGEITPGTRSGETSLRTGRRPGDRRTVEVVNPQGERVSVPRNVAADFL